MSADQEFPVAHNSLPSASASAIFTALNNRAPSVIVNNSYPVSCVLFITTSVGTDLQITSPSNLRLGKNFSDNTVYNEIPNSLYSGFNASTEYGLIVNPANGTYSVTTQGNAPGSFTINASDVCSTGITSATATSTGGGFNLNVSTSTQTLTIVAADSNPPSITINTPQNNGTYQKTASVTASITVVDPEGSAIATTTFRFNGALVNGSQPLPFSSAPTGTSTLVVSATDAFGNTGYATSSFKLTAAADTQPPVITITSPLKYGLYERTDVVYITATVTDDSPIATTTYWFNGKKVSPTAPLVFNSSTPLVSKVQVSATDVAGNAATSTLVFFVVKNKNSCLLDIIAILTAIKNDKTLPDKPTIENLIADCAALLKGLHRWDWDKDRDRHY